MIHLAWRQKLVPVLITALAVSTSCRGRDKTDAPLDSSASKGIQDNIRRIDSTARLDTACREVGDWRDCNLEKRLESAGLAPRRAQGAIRQPFLSVPGIVFALGSGELQSYLYADTTVLRRDLARLDTVRVAPPTMQVTWRKTPTLIHSNNLLAILLSDDETQVERVRNAITAGLPAAPGSRTASDSVAAATDSSAVRDSTSRNDSTPPTP
jgi:hypothetical protein